MHFFLFLFYRESVLCVSVIWKPVASFSHFVRFYYIVYFYITMEKLLRFLSLDFIFLLVRKLWHVERQTHRAVVPIRVSVTADVVEGGEWQRFVSMVKANRTRIVHGKKVVGKSRGIEQNSTLLVRSKIAMFGGQGESREIIKPNILICSLNTITM